jgi:peptide/nickel transport system ATP-binding protein/oligopeptide transport system ATP-binding protein
LRRKSPTIFIPLQPIVWQITNLFPKGKVLMEAKPLLEVKGLVTSFRSDEGKIRAVDEISFVVGKGETLAIVGESGCGKSVTALSIMRLIPEENGSIDAGQIILNGEDILKYPRSKMRTVRGNQISMIFQEPMTALNPVYTVGQQIMEVFKIHRNYSDAKAREEAIKMLRMVKIPDPERRIDEYPVQMSGGMRQRVLIAIALACEPDLLIADEPTTALDVTIQAQIIDLMKDLQKARGTSIIFVTHDMGVVAETANHVAIMYAGKVVEYGSVYEIFDNPRHPYTQGLLASIPTMDDQKDQKLETIAGTVPSLFELPKGCRFNTRCPHAKGVCFEKHPPLVRVDSGQQVACYWATGKIQD